MSIKKTLVKDWMTSSPIVIEAEMTLPRAHRLMKENSIRRLPVVQDGKLVGIITLGDLREAGPSDASALSLYELNYLLANLVIERVMTKDPLHIQPETTLHDAAEMMLKNKIGGLPVVKDGELVGIITETDIFRVVIEVFE